MRCDLQNGGSKFLCFCASLRMSPYAYRTCKHHCACACAYAYAYACVVRVNQA